MLTEQKVFITDNAVVAVDPSAAAAGEPEVQYVPTVWCSGLSGGTLVESNSRRTPLARRVSVELAVVDDASRSRTTVRVFSRGEFFR